MLNHIDRPEGAGKILFSMRSLYFTFWASNFITHQYLAMFLREFSFTDDLTIGLIMSASSFVATIAQFFWGHVADHARTKNRVLITTIAGLIGGVLIMVSPRHTGLVTLVACVLFLRFFDSVPGMLVDTIVVENVNRTGAPFGQIRVFASLGAAAGALSIFLVSLWLTLRPTTAYIVGILCAAISFVPALSLPPTKGHAYGMKKTDKDNASFLLLLKNRRMLLLLCYLLLMFTGVQVCNLYLGVYFATDAGLNAGLGAYGLFYAICIGIEAATMSLCNRLWQTMSIYHTFTLVSVAAFFRPFIVYLAPNVYFMYFLSISQALLFAPLWTRMTPYVQNIVPKEMRASGQAACSIMIAGVAPMIGAALGGVIAEAFGMRNMFGVASCFLAAVGVLFFFLFRQQRAWELSGGAPDVPTDNDDED
ncbi:MAG: MFS transporter [Peptococcaceae bacterium]|jgi:MFS family permease|nr:MFS transporter [Peptococcaceae bacterium]